MSHPIQNPYVHHAANTTRRGNGTVLIGDLIDALKDVSHYDLGYGETTCRVARAAAQALEQLAEAAGIDPRDEEVAI